MDDLISREAALKAACEGFCHPGIFCPDTGCRELEPLKRSPAAKMGRWCDVGSLSCRCSECGCKSQKEFMFCPNCGAKMEGRTDDEG